jgi:transposase
MAGVAPKTVRFWLDRYDREGVAGLVSRKPPGRPRRVSGRDRARILALSRQTPPPETGLSHWTAAELANYLRRCEGISVSHNFIAELWRENGIAPHRERRSFSLSSDACFAPKLRDVVELYTHPPEGAVILSIDAKPGVQALDPAEPERPSGGGHAASAR